MLGVGLQPREREHTAPTTNTNASSNPVMEYTEDEHGLAVLRVKLTNKAGDRLVKPGWPVMME
jgi:hypothetical protein